MKINKTKLEKLKPCQPGMEWYIQNGSTDLLETLLKVNTYEPAWARWLFTKLMTKKQNIRIAVYSAELVLDIFEEKYPNDNRPRKAILAAKKYLKSPTLKNKRAADAAANAAAYAAHAAYAHAAYAAADAADAAAYATAYAAAAYAAAANAAAYAAAYAAAANAAAYAAADAKKIQEKIIRKAVKILDEKR